MEGSLGEKIGDGAYAEIHAWAPGQVVKLFKPRVPMGLAWHEAQMTHAVFAAGGPAPEMLGVSVLDGRFAMVLPRLDGPTLLQLAQSGALTPTQTGAILASLFLAVHQRPAPRDVLSLRASIEGTFRSPASLVPQHLATGVLALIDRLPAGETLCHGDLHPGNVIMTADGPRLIDWLGTVRAPAALDLACTHFLLSEIAPHYADDPNRPRATNAAMQAEYARATGLSPAALTAEIESWMPIVHVRALSGGALPDFRDRLIQRVEAALNQADGIFPETGKGT
jgi:hypothetical protein